MTTDPSGTPPWAAAMAGDAAFHAEQAALARHWTFLGFEQDIPALNDWFRTSLAGREIFVQRFAGGLRGFENRCAHRYYPLRTAARGNGAVVCGFHQWRYDETGFAFGIPQCREQFGKTPRQIGARLQAVEIATCGPLIFGRFAGDGKGPDLAEWLGAGHAILSHVAGPPLLRHSYEQTVRAHWKLLMQVSLDDYHLVAIHPRTFGKTGYLDPEIVRYFRFAPHSAYIPAAPPDALERMAAECAAGTWDARGYRIFQFFPNLIVIMLQAFSILGRPVDYVLVQHLVPEAHDRTRSITRSFVRRPRDAAEDGGVRRAVRGVLEPFVSLGVLHRMRQIHREDNAAVERLQAAIATAGPLSNLGAHEERIAWFEEDYARLLGDPAGGGAGTGGA